jgi:hypothetical protein
VGNSVFGAFAARGNVQIPAKGIDTTDKIDPFFFSVTLPRGRLSPLAPSLGGSVAASPGGGATGDSVTGAGGMMGAAIPDGRGGDFATLSDGPAQAVASNALLALSVALEPAGPFWLGPGAVSVNGPATVSAGGQDVQVPPLGGNVATVDQVFAVKGWEGQNRSLSLFGRTQKPLDGGGGADDWPAADVLLDTVLPESGFAG